ncbi:hypothetical protein [Aurantimonas sp. VKM B-3413]|uniref:hypothetical protein n=1 Tax=Aurantimonas sp. VKM B-3413 TaxID=2779401 RepID=UPI001E58CFA2|nr:hypothetical protein [Aurantimonas sp. VKM B-3413]MCB8835849.1 hypothetical protein [Aurantimonas sp. VKM B-3413]
MNSGHELAGLMKFVGRPEWAEAFEDVLAEHFAMALEAFDLDYDEIPDLLGEHWAGTLWGCAFEDFLTRRGGPTGRNLVEDYLKRRGWKESAQGRRYMAALRSSFMSLYEVSDIVPGASFRARDLILGGEPRLVHEKSATQSLKPWDRIGARLVDLGERTVIGGGLLPFGPEASDAILRGLRGDEADDFGQAEPTPPIDEEALCRAGPLFTTAWLLDVLPRALGEMPAMVNSDGEEPVFHQFRYPLAKGIRQKDLTVLLNATGVLTPVRTKIWDWLGERPDGVTADSDRASGAVAEAIRPDGRIILGHVELEGRTLILTTNSVSRADQATAMLREALGDRILEPTVRIETLDDMAEEAFLDDDTDLDEDMEIPPEITASLVHRLLDGQYRRTLDEPVPMLGGLSPRAAAASDVHRVKAVDWLKYLENQSRKARDPTDPMASYDFGWMWKELGLEDLRR